MHVEQLPTDSLRPYDRNPRQNDKAVEAVAASIRAFGFRQPIVVDAERVIIAGHTRWRAAKFLQMETVPVLIAADLSPEKVRAYRIADNKVAELAEWDEALLAHEANLLEGTGLDLTDFGFTSKEVDALLQGAAPEDPAAATPQTLNASYEVVVKCRDEAHQREIYEQLTQDGLECRVITV